MPKLENKSVGICEKLFKEKLAGKNSYALVIAKEDLPKCIPFLNQELKNRLICRTVDLYDYDETKLLLEAKADPNTSDVSYSNNPLLLFKTIENCNIRMMRLLLDHGADLYKTVQGYDSFMWFHNHYSDSDSKSTIVSSYMFDMMIKHVEGKKKAD